MPIINEHFGKVVMCRVGGVDCELIIVEYPVEADETKTKARCIDRSGARYQVLKNRMKGTGEKLSGEEIDKIAARAFCRRNRASTK